MKIVITGANGHLGRRLIRCLSDMPAGEKIEVLAVVRSKRAEQTLRDEFGPDLAIEVIEYADQAALGQTLLGADYCIHLVGIIKQTKSNTYDYAHENPARALAAAASDARLKGIIYLSILGADRSANPCLRSRHSAENILRQGGTPVCVVRVPMVLGENDYASMSIRRKAMSAVAVEFRAGSLEQPIYADDVVRAIQSIVTNFSNETLELAGAESLTREALIRRACQVLGVESTRIVSLPLFVGLGIGGLLELLPDPPVTRDMLGVLDHDDAIDPTDACTHLGIELTSLDASLDKVLH
jgi:NADH dehydrogenase